MATRGPGETKIETDRRRIREKMAKMRREIKEMIENCRTGDLSGAWKIHSTLLPLFKGLFITSNPIPVKAALAIIGRPAGPPRLPLVPATPEERASVEQAMRDAGVL